MLYLPATVITSGWWVRIITGTQTLALLGMLSIALLFFRAQRATLNA
ncbi:MAG: hypothetical protein HGA65_05770 [Oscillochloris sp.]|nr:hypothetical protein [Oscillochloris sp.]